MDESMSPSHWKDPQSDLASRSKFSLNPPDSRLSIANIQAQVHLLFSAPLSFHKLLAICQYLSETTKSVVNNHWLCVFQDAGQYKCRVDYHLQQTSFQLLDVSIIVPPKTPIIHYNGQPGM